MVLVVGGDHLGAIRSNLESLGLGSVHHVRGRNVGRVDIPAGTQLVVVLVDYINHNLARKVKAEAKRRELPVVFARRSWSAICQSLERCAICPMASGCGQARSVGRAVS